MAKVGIPLTIKCLREVRKLTQQEIADAIGISQTEYSFIETGSRSPSDDTRIKVERYFKAPINVLLSDILENTENGNIKKYGLKIR